MVSRWIVLVAVFVAACGSGSVHEGEYNTRLVRLPDGYEVRCEVMADPQDMARGMMFRDSLAENRGMLFLHGEPGKYAYWMYQVEIPLDIIWMDSSHRILEMSPNTPPCEENFADLCPEYGGSTESMVVLEMAAGSIEKHGLRVGQRLDI